MKPNGVSYPADLYEAVHVGTPGDITFYQRVTEGASSVLELGCGSGRILASLDAPILVGVDRDPARLAIAETRLGGRAALVEADVRALSLDARFDCVIAPYSTLYCLTNEADLLSTLRGVRAHLEEDGVFGFDVWYADEFHAHGDPNELPRFEAINTITVGGVRYAVEERTVWDKGAQTLVVDYRHTPENGGESRTGRIVHRYVLEAQLHAHLDAVGLTVTEAARIETEDGEVVAVVASLRRRVPSRRP